MSNAANTRNIPWVDGRTIGGVLEETVRRHAKRDAMAFPKLDLRWNWSRLGDEVETTARALLALGVRPGEHVAVWATNVPRWVILQFATARIGAVLVTINPADRPFELRYVLQQSDAVALFLVDRFKSSDYFSMLGEVHPQLGASQTGAPPNSDFPRLRHVVAMKGTAPPGVLPWEDFAAGAASIDSGKARRTSPSSTGSRKLRSQ